MAILKDDRTPEQVKTHALAWVGTDSFMSGWGEAEGGASYAGWAFKSGDMNDCQIMMERRSDMKRVRLVLLDGYRPQAAHTHIYVYRDVHKQEGG
jgi:hypothetical protein